MNVLNPEIVGVAFAGGIILMWWAFKRTHPRLSDRVRSRQRQQSADSRLMMSFKNTLTKLVDSMGSTTASVQRRLELCGRKNTVAHFRLFQLAVAIFAAMACGSLAVWGAWVSRAWWVSLPMVAIGALLGAAGADQLLTWLARKRQAAIERQVPDASELLALAVSAGESVAGALARLSQAGDLELADELAVTSLDIQLGISTSRAVAALEQRNDSPALSRLCETLVTALERGTPLAGVLRDQARDIRERGRQKLMEDGGRKEIAMLIPVVFLILPITIVFAFYPGMMSLTIST